MELFYKLINYKIKRETGEEEYGTVGFAFSPSRMGTCLHMKPWSPYSQTTSTSLWTQTTTKLVPGPSRDPRPPPSCQAPPWCLGDLPPGGGHFMLFSIRGGGLSTIIGSYMLFNIIVRIAYYKGRGMLACIKDILVVFFPLIHT